MKARFVCLALAVLFACAAVCVRAHVNEEGVESDYTQDARYVNPRVLGDLAAEQALFGEWKAREGKAYSNGAEESYRFLMFQQTLARVVKNNNAQLSAGQEPNFGLNAFADLDPQEWAERYLTPNAQLMSKGVKQLLSGVRLPVSHPRVGSIPPYWDWRQEGEVVTRVKNQGQCGSCWTFSVMETVESAWAIKYGVKQYLSAQQIVDCDWDTGNKGCKGGDPSYAFDYVRQYGLMNDTTYPYRSGSTRTNGTCKYEQQKVVAQLRNWEYATLPCEEGPCTDTDDVSLAANLAAKGPVAIIVDAGNWQDYTRGTFSWCGRSAERMNHAVQLVGYDATSDEGQSGKVGTWRVRNSWGDSWGNRGYITLAGSRNAPNTCGLSNQAIQALV